MKKWFLLLIVTIMFSSQSEGREFIHVFTSKGIYETCEDLWFKCTVIDDSLMRVSARPHTAYVEIADPSDSVVWKEKYRISNGTVDGHVYVGDSWKPGEYTMTVHTRGSLGRCDTVVYPRRLLVVSELPEVPDFLKSAKERVRQIDMPDSLDNPGLTVSVSLDSAQYHVSGKVKATVRVTDRNGTPVQTVFAISVADALYSYPPADTDIRSQIYGLKHDSVRSANRTFEPFLSDGAASGRLRSEKMKNGFQPAGQYISVFDDFAQKGNLNIIATDSAGRFEVPSETGISVKKRMYLKPLLKKELKPCLDVDDPFSEISAIREKASKVYYPSFRRKAEQELYDSADYSGRHTVRLDEVLVTAKAGRYPKRDKTLGYLDSLASDIDIAWTCGCPGGYGTTFLNDYIEGYTHHPNGYGKPRKIGKPKKGEKYELIKYSGTTSHDRILDIQLIEYTGPRYSEEELLRMNGLWKADGYYGRRRFRLPDENDLAEGFEDNRNTLLWLPRAQTDANGEFQVVFPTSGIKSTFKISLLVIPENVNDAVSYTRYFRVV